MQNDDSHQTLKENIPAYALGALDPEEAAALEAHLPICAACQSELAAYHPIRDSLPMALPPKAPPAALRRRLQQHLPSAQTASRPRRTWSFNQLALGLAVVILLALNLLSLFQMQSFQRQQAQLAREVQTSQIALAMLAYPGTQSLPINAAQISGALLVDKDRSVAVLIVWNLPPVQNNQTYQAWLTDRQGNRTSAAIFNPDPSLPFTSVTITSPDELSAYTGLGVTVEPGGGSKQPTGPRLFKIDF